ncbi:MAG: hypothetical protein ACK4M7_08835, partial [Burkholderiales bacterium]
LIEQLIAIKSKLIGGNKIHTTEQKHSNKLYFIAPANLTLSEKKDKKGYPALQSLDGRYYYQAYDANETPLLTSDGFSILTNRAIREPLLNAAPTLFLQSEEAPRFILTDSAPKHYSPLSATIRSYFRNLTSPDFLLKLEPLSKYLLETTEQRPLIADFSAFELLFAYCFTQLEKPSNSSAYKIHTKTSEMLLKEHLVNTYYRTYCIGTELETKIKLIHGTPLHLLLHIWEKHNFHKDVFKFPLAQELLRQCPLNRLNSHKEGVIHQLVRVIYAIETGAVRQTILIHNLNAFLTQLISAGANIDLLNAEKMTALEWILEKHITILEKNPNHPLPTELITTLLISAPNLQQIQNKLLPNLRYIAPKQAEKITEIIDRHQLKLEVLEGYLNKESFWPAYQKLFLIDVSGGLLAPTTPENRLINEFKQNLLTELRQSSIAVLD